MSLFKPRLFPFLLEIKCSPPITMSKTAMILLAEWLFPLSNLWQRGNKTTFNTTAKLWKIILLLCQCAQTIPNLWYIYLFFCINIFVSLLFLPGEGVFICILTLHHYHQWWTSSPTHCSSLNQFQLWPSWFFSPSILSLPFIVFALKRSSRKPVITFL